MDRICTLIIHIIRVPKLAIHLVRQTSGHRQSHPHTHRLTLKYACANSFAFDCIFLATTTHACKCSMNISWGELQENRVYMLGLSFNVCIHSQLMPPPEPLALAISAAANGGDIRYCKLGFHSICYALSCQQLIKCSSFCFIFHFNFDYGLLTPCMVLLQELLAVVLELMFFPVSI